MDEHIAAVKAKQRINQSSMIGREGLVGIKDEEILEWDHGEIRVFRSNCIHHKIKLELNDQDSGIGKISIDNDTFT